MLSDALAEWGVGGKTSAGYGQGATVSWKTAELPPSPLLGPLDDWLDCQRHLIRNGTTQRTVLDNLRNEWSVRLRDLQGSNRDKARKAIVDVIKSKSVLAARDAFLQELWPTAE